MERVRGRLGGGAAARCPGRSEYESSSTCCCRFTCSPTNSGAWPYSSHALQWRVGHVRLSGPADEFDLCSTTQKTTPVSANEDAVLAKLRQRERERERLMEEMRRQDEEEGAAT